VTDEVAQPGQTLFGVSRGLESSEVVTTRNYLLAAWRAQYGRAPSTLSFDLDLLADLFRSHVQAKRLREAAQDLAPIPLSRPRLPEAIFVPVDDSRGFVTPEGRVLLDQLNRGDLNSGTILTRDSLIAAYAAVAEFYGGDHRRWMRKELAGGDVRPATIGFAIFLLINNSVGPDRCLYLPSSQRDEEALARTILPVVSTFSTGIGGSAIQRRESERLRSNWIVTESRRQLGRFISRSDDSQTVSIWITSGAETGLIEELGRLLSRRRGLTLESLRSALAATFGAYEEARPMLASWDLSYERPSHSIQVIDAVVSAYLKAAKA
jgi:hypothetical protein